MSDRPTLFARASPNLERSDFESITILFASEGGNTDQALSLYNYVGLYPSLFKCMPLGMSAAPPSQFFSLDTRAPIPFSRFFFHAYDWGFEGRQMVDRVAEALQRLESDIQISRKIGATHPYDSGSARHSLYQSANANDPDSRSSQRGRNRVRHRPAWHRSKRRSLDSGLAYRIIRLPSLGKTELPHSHLSRRFLASFQNRTFTCSATYGIVRTMNQLSTESAPPSSPHWSKATACAAPRA